MNGIHPHLRDNTYMQTQEYECMFDTSTPAWQYIHTNAYITGMLPLYYTYAHRYIYKSI